MQVKNNQLPNSQPIKPVKQKSVWSQITKSISACWKKCFPNTFSSDASVSTQGLKNSVVKLPPVTKASPFAEASWTLSNIREIINPVKPPVQNIVNPVKPVVLQPKKIIVDLSDYKTSNRIELKEFPDFVISIDHTDLFETNAEVIVNAANVGLGGGGGIDGAIHKAGGATYAAKHRALKTEKPDFREGDALIIEGVSLNSLKTDPATRKPTKVSFTTTKDIIVTAGPNRQGYNGSKENIDADNIDLYNCYRNALQLAHDKGKKSIAFPAISAGIFAYPKDEAAGMSLMAIRDFIQANPTTQLKSISIHCFNPFDVNKEKELADWHYYRNVVNQNKDLFNEIPLKSTTTKLVAPVQPKLTEAQINQKRMDERVSVKLELETLSVALQNRLSQKPIVEPRAHKNFSNTCYMNAALQSLNASHGVHLALVALIGADLTWKGDDSYDSIEQRLSRWAPIKIKETDLSVLQSSKKTLEDQIVAEMETEPLLKIKNQLALVDELINLHQDLSLREDRILFKWSFLLYMQACKYGTDAHVEQALAAHHRLCFAIARHTDFESTPGPLTITESHDTSAYMQLWHNMLGLGVNTSFHKQYVHDGKTFIKGHRSGPEGVINMTLKPNSTFLDGLATTFNDKIESSLTFDGVTIPAGQVSDIRKIYDTPPRVIILNVNAERRTTSLPFNSDKIDKTGYLNIVNLRPYFDEGKIGPHGASYKIVGLTVHFNGDKDGKNGHYYSYVRRQEKGSDAQWYKCNDSKITPVKSEDVPFERATTLTCAQVKEVK